MALDAKTEVMQQVRQQAALQNARFLVDVSCNANLQPIPRLPLYHLREARCRRANGY